MPRCLLSRIYSYIGQPERGASIAREGLREAAERGNEVLVGYFDAMEAMAWTSAGAFDSILGFSLSLAGAIRARNDDLPGALAVLHEATVQQHGDGNRLGLGMTLERAAAVLAQLGEAEPAAVLAGTVSARFRFLSPPLTTTSGSRSTKPWSPPAAHSAKPHTALRSGEAPRWTTTRSPITHWASSGR